MRRAWTMVLGIALMAALAFQASDVAQGQAQTGACPPVSPAAARHQPARRGRSRRQGSSDAPHRPQVETPPRGRRATTSRAKTGRPSPRTSRSCSTCRRTSSCRCPSSSPTARTSRRLVGIRIAANRLLASLPRDKPGAGLDVYKNDPRSHGQDAADPGAIADGDKQKFADVAQRFLWTDAGGEAAERLATILLDRGDFMAAAQAFDRLIQRDGVEKLEPLTLYKAAIAFTPRQHQGRQGQQGQGLEAAPGQGARRPRPSAARPSPWTTPSKYLDRIRGGVNTSIHDWPMVGGNPSRNGQGVGDTAFMQPAGVPCSAPPRRGEPADHRRHPGQEVDPVGRRTASSRRLEGKGEAVIPAFAPVTATVIGSDGKPKTAPRLPRPTTASAAVDLKTGKREWHVPLALEPRTDAARTRPATVPSLTGWVQQFKDQHNKPGVIIENSTVGTMSSDGNRVYLIDDLQVPAASSSSATRGAACPQPGIGVNQLRSSPAWTPTSSRRISHRSGKLLWELRAAPRPTRTTLRPEARLPGHPLPRRPAVPGRQAVLPQREEPGDSPGLPRHRQAAGQRIRRPRTSTRPSSGCSRWARPRRRS